MFGVRRGVCALLLCGVVFAGCGDGAEPESTAVIEGVVVAGPVCPTETDPPDPGCAPLPVAAAEIIAINLQTGSAVVAVTDTEGRFRIEVSPGTVRLRAEPVEGLMGVPGPVEIIAAAGGRHSVDLVYDTGIR